MGQWAWYAVQKGRQTGVYRTWDECHAQVKGFGGARFKGFQTREGAEDYVRGSAIDFVPRGRVSGGLAALGGGVSSSAPVRSVNGLSATRVPPSSSSSSSSSSPKPGSSAPIRGMIGLSAEVLSSLLKLDHSTPARSVNGLSTAPLSSAPKPSSSTSLRSINGLSAVAAAAAAAASSSNPNFSTPATSINKILPSAEEPSSTPVPPSSAPARSKTGLSVAAAALSTLPTSSPSSKFYAVAVGRQPGVYLTWRECEAQVSGVRGARYKSFGDRRDAVEFLAVNGGGGHFSQFEGLGAGGFKPDERASFSQEFERLSSSQGWRPGSQEYDNERARALRNELRAHYFSSAPAAVDVGEEEEENGLTLAAIKEEEEEENATAFLAGFAEKEEEDDDIKIFPTIKEEEDSEALAEARQARDEELVELQGFQKMCRAVGKRPAGTLEGCKTALRATLVNIVDLVDVRRTGRKVEVWADFGAFMRYTLTPDKTFRAKLARADPILECFLKDFRRHQRQLAKRAGTPARKRRLPSSGGVGGRERKRRRGHR